MPERHAQHEASGCRPMSIIERWPCKIKTCRNYGQLCYYAVTDSAEDHLPIHSVVMQFWLAGIARGECTVDVPPREIIEQWQLQNLRSLQRREERRDEKAERAARKEAARKSSAAKSSARKSSAAKSSVRKSSAAKSSARSQQ